MRCLIVSEIDPAANEAHVHISKMSEFKGINLAHTVDEAVHDLKKYKFDLVILDISKPEDANMQLLKWIRSARVNIGVIFVSKESQVNYVREAFGYGICDYVLKPFTSERFREAVIRASGRRAYLSGFKYMNQAEIDHFIALNVFKAVEIMDSKGISAETLKRIKEVIMHIDGGFTAKQVSDKTGLSRITVRRYLEQMVDSSLLETDLEYGEIGRPQKIYKVVEDIR